MSGERQAGSGALLVYCSCPDQQVADRIAGQLVDRRLAACVTAIAGVRSTYRWQGELQRDDEVLLLIKSHRERYDALQQAIVELHPYELPEVVAVSVRQGLPGYLHWIEQCTTSQS